VQKPIAPTQLQTQ